MPSLWSAFSSSSSASSSPSNSPQKVKKGSKSFGWSFGSPSSNRRLTRQRKLRHIGDDELGLRPQSMPVSPDASGSRLDHHHHHHQQQQQQQQHHHWSRSAVPQPLPLPDVNSHLKNNSNDNLPLPRDGPTKLDADPSTSAITSSNDQFLEKAADHTARRSTRTPTYQRRRFFQGLKVEDVEPKFRLNVLARSAPSSGFTSPILSPQRFSTGDIYHSSYRAHSALEASALDRLSGSSQASPSKVTASPDHSPLHSPNFRHPGQNVFSQNGVQHVHHKSLQENHLPWHDSNNTSLHRLPLPPGVSRSLPSSFIHHHIDKPETPTMKGQWQKGKLIGRGTYGSVYAATHRETGALCAMKEVDCIPDDPKCAESIKQLEQEIKVLRHLKHPNIVQYYGSEIIEDRFCIYLEYVHPGSINKFVREHCGAMSERIVRNFTRHILSGLAFLHGMKTIHRDIKGANLLVNSSGVVKLADFGLAKHLTGHAVNLSLKGSPHWMAPEVLQAVMRNDTNPDHAYAVDIWSLGCTVIEMLTGKPPWSEFDGVQAMFNVLHRTPPIPETLSVEGKDFLKNCLQRVPSDRLSAVELLNHPFVRNLRDQNVTICRDEFSGMKLLDTPSSPKDSRENNKDQMHDILTHNGETSAQSPPENSDSGAACCPSPRSTLEILHCIYSPELNGSSNHVSPWNVSNTLLARAGNNPFVSLRNQGRQILHL